MYDVTSHASLAVGVAAIWWLLEDAGLSEAAASAIGDPENIVHVSVAVGWEIATKVRRGKLSSMANHVATFEAEAIAEGFLHLPAQPRHCLQAGLLAGNHGDPFDRLIAAQALIEGLTVVTCDRQIAAFGCEVLW